MRTYNIFISHSWTYSDHYNRLADMFKSEPYFDYRDYSVPKDSPIHNAPTTWQLREAIENQIRFCHAVVIMAGVYSSYSKWINIEIEIAKKFGKPIIAVIPWGQERASQTVQEAAHRVVRWNAAPIVQAIKDLT